MAPSPGIFPRFLQLETTVPFLGFQIICPFLWSLKSSPFGYLCLQMYCRHPPVRRQFSCTAPPLLSRGCTGRQHRYEWAGAWVPETTQNSKHTEAKDHGLQTDYCKPQGPAHAHSYLHWTGWEKVQDASCVASTKMRQVDGGLWSHYVDR